MQRERERERLREKQASCREPDVGLHPGSPGPWAAGGTKLLHHWGCPVCWFKEASCHNPTAARKSIMPEKQQPEKVRKQIFPQSSL